MKAILIILSVGYVAMCIALYYTQRRMLYFPVPALDLEGVPTISFLSGGVGLQGWVINEGQEKAIIYYGGNAEQIEHNLDFFRSVTPEYTVYLVPYRGYGNNPGKPTEEDLYKDAETIYDEIAPKHSAITLMGRSLGSGIATYMAVKRPIEKLILVTPYDSIENVAKEAYWILPVKYLIHDRYPSWQRAPEIKVPTLVLVAGGDEVISRKRSENLIKHLPEANTRVVVLNTALHNDISVYPRFGEEVKQFLMNE